MRIYSETPQKRYLIVDVNLEYNDEYFYAVGQCVCDRLLYDKETAQRNARERLKQTLIDLWELPAIDEQNWKDYALCLEFLNETNAEPWDKTWPEFFEWCDVNQKDWANCVPQLVNVIELIPD